LQPIQHIRLKYTHPPRLRAIAAQPNTPDMRPERLCAAVQLPVAARPGH
jgi:hypothetical protein